MRRLGILSIFATVYCLSMVALAADPPAPTGAAGSAATTTVVKKDGDGKRNPLDVAAESEERKINYCDGMDVKLHEARAKVHAACGESGFGKVDQCILDADACVQQFSEEDNADINTMFGRMSEETADVKCPKSSNQAGDLEKKFDKLQEKSEKLEKQAIEDKKKVASDFDKLQEEIAKNDADYKEAKIKADEQKAKQDVEVDKAFSQIREDIESTHAQILEAQAKLANMFAEKAEKLEQMSNAIVQSDCELKIMEIAAKIPGSNSASSQGMIRAGAKKNKNLKMRYNQCIQGMLSARKKLIENYDNTIKQVQYAIARAQTKVTSREQDIEKVQKATLAALENAQKGIVALEENYNSNKLRLANKLQNLTTNTSLQETQTSTSLQTTKLELNKTSNSLARIGGTDAKDVKKTYKDVNSANEAYYALLDTFPVKRCCDQTLQDKTPYSSNHCDEAKDRDAEGTRSKKRSEKSKSSSGSR